MPNRCTSEECFVVWNTAATVDRVCFCLFAQVPVKSSKTKKGGHICGDENVCEKEKRGEVNGTRRASSDHLNCV